MKKKRIVLNDKDKIASVIKELDEKKNEALRNAWKKVNKVRHYVNFLNSRQYILSYITDNKNASIFKISVFSVDSPASVLHILVYWTMKVVEFTFITFGSESR